jgi:hypothetical protein
VAGVLDASVDKLRDDDWNDAPPPAFAHIQWCRSLMACMRDGAFWHVPRSMLVYRKKDNTLTLIERGPMPPSDGAMTEDVWAGYQRDDHANTKRVFEAAGFVVYDETSA